MFLCFVVGASALSGKLGPVFISRSPVRRPPRFQTWRNPNGIFMKEESGKENPGDRPLPQGFGTKPSSASHGEKLAFVGNDKIGISFTCDAQGCGERITKSVKRRSYEKGTVLIRCPKCEKHHIIADNMGMYSEITGGKKNVEEMAKDTGVTSTRVGADAFRLDNGYREAKNLDATDSELTTDDTDSSARL